VSGTSGRPDTRPSKCRRKAASGVANPEGLEPARSLKDEKESNRALIEGNEWDIITQDTEIRKDTMQVLSLLMQLAFRFEQFFLEDASSRTPVHSEKV